MASTVILNIECQIILSSCLCQMPSMGTWTHFMTPGMRQPAQPAQWLDETRYGTTSLKMLKTVHSETSDNYHLVLAKLAAAGPRTSISFGLCQAGLGTTAASRVQRLRSSQEDTWLRSAPCTSGIHWPLRQSWRHTAGSRQCACKA